MSSFFSTFYLSVLNLNNVNVTANFPRRPIELHNPSYTHPPPARSTKLDGLYAFVAFFFVADSRSVQREGELGIVAGERGVRVLA